MSFVDDVERVVHRFASVTDPVEQQSQIDDALDVLCGPDSGSISWRRHRTYAIEMGNVESRAAQYRWLRSLEIASAPDVVAMFPIAEGFVMVLRYWACREDEDLLPAMAPGVTFSPQARAQLLHDLDVLAKQGKRHLYVGRGLHCWGVGANSGVIVLHSWSALVAGSDQAQREDREAAEQLLASR